MRDHRSTSAVATAAVISFATLASRRGGRLYNSQATCAVDALAMFSVVNRASPYEVPIWAQPQMAKSPANGRLRIGNFPTPLHVLDTSKLLGEMQIFHGLKMRLVVKRDDMSGGPELGGNKIRKLEFLLAEALATKCDSVVTIGGEQSNHCRATASAARLVGLEPHLILRTKRATYEQDGDKQLGLTGNIMFDRLSGSTIYTCTTGEYGKFGQAALVETLCNTLKETCQKNPYPIPVGGSNALGTWGYINGVAELQEQLNVGSDIDHVVFACGSGGTLAGITLGIHLCAQYYNLNKIATGNDSKFGNCPEIHAVGVCDDPDYFYGMLESLANEMGLNKTGAIVIDSNSSDFRQWVHIHQGKGLGYAISTEEELKFIRQFAMNTGIVLDPVYSGKAMYRFLQLVRDNPDHYRDSTVLFWHTGGALGVYEKDWMEKLRETSPVNRLDAYNKLRK